jgi:hypothetical protein
MAWSAARCGIRGFPESWQALQRAPYTASPETSAPRVNPVTAHTANHAQTLKRRISGSILLSMVRTLILTLTLAVAASAQWEPYPWKHVPRTPDGKVDLNAPAQRTPYGKIDLSGFWMPENPTKHLLNLASDMKEEEIPLKPWARDLYNQRIANNGKDHPGVSCLPSGIPEKDNIPDGLKLVQTEDLTLLLHESRTIYRQIFTDGRTLPKNPQPAWMGYSVGRWDKDTFVVETIGQNGRTWLDMRGLPGTEALKITERFSRPKIGHMDIDVTIDDAEAYIKPWNVRLSWRLLPDTDLIESICEENNRDPGHMVGK